MRICWRVESGDPRLEERNCRIMTVTLIDDYEVMYSANQFPPRIWLLAGGSYIGQLVFRPDDAALPDDSATSLYYHVRSFPNIIDLLRNEKPLYYLFAGSGSGFENGVKTTPEAVGEGEA
jgi:hypothetical protein